MIKKIDFKELPISGAVVIIHHRSDASKSFHETKKTFLKDEHLEGFIEEMKRSVLIDQVKVYLKDAKRVTRSTKRRQQIHYRSLNELRHLEDVFAGRFGHYDSKRLGKVTLMHKKHLKHILPEKYNPFFQKAQGNLEEILEHAQDLCQKERINQL